MSVALLAAWSGLSVDDQTQTAGTVVPARPDIYDTIGLS